MTGPTYLDDDDDDLRIRVERPGPARGQGERITELWAWTAYDPMTNVEGIMAARTPRGGALPMVGTVREIVERYKPYVDAAVREAQDPKPEPMLRRFVPVEMDEELDPEAVRAVAHEHLPLRDDDYGQGAADA